MWRTVCSGVSVAAGQEIDAPARAQDGHVVAEAEDLVDEMADEQDRDALPLQRGHDLEQPVDLAAGDGRGRLVHDQHARVERQRLDDLDRLPLGDAERLHRQAHVDLHAQAQQQLVRGRVHRRPVDAAAAPRLAADEDVLGDRQIGKHRRVLVDDGDAVALRVGRALNDDLARRRAGSWPLSGRMDAGEDLDQRALAGAVLAGERMHAPAVQAEIDVGQHLDRAEPLGDAAQLDAAAS